MSLSNKIDFAVVFRVTNANPNGDPLNGNRPRTTYDGLGELSDVCLKRKIRDRLMDSGQAIFVQSDDRKTDNHVSLRSRADAILKGVKTREESAKMACKTWMDVRTFGQLFAFQASGSKKGKGQDAEGAPDDKSVSIGIRGPVSVQSAFSVSPVSITSIQITKSVSGEGDGSKRGSDTMGMKHRVDCGTYVFFGSMNPQLAVRTGFSDADAEAIKSVLPRLFENDASSARPEGSMEVLKVIWWKHNCASGQASSAKVHRSLTVNDTDDAENLLVFATGTGPSDSIDNWPRPEIIDGK
ncbi:MAG TPA: type I-C CRISPR-associated protein Cas7/Csd2 [Armatimonadota bacterium]|jgi:CRISPR-associated protein Csd2